MTTKFVMPKEVTALSTADQNNIKNVLVANGLLLQSGGLPPHDPKNIPPRHKAALESALTSMGLENGQMLTFWPNPKCILARIAEAAAVAACASVPGGQIAIAACIAAAHAAASAVCD